VPLLKILVNSLLGFYGSTVSAYRRESLVLAIGQLLGGSSRLSTDRLRRKVFVQRYVYGIGEEQDQRIHFLSLLDQLEGGSVDIRSREAPADQRHGFELFGISESVGCHRDTGKQDRSGYHCSQVMRDSRITKYSESNELEVRRAVT